MASATGKTYEDQGAARQEALALKNRGLKAIVVGPLNSAHIVGPANQPLQWPVTAGKTHFLVIGTDATVEVP